MASVSLSARATAVLLCCALTLPVCAEAPSSNEKKQNSTTKTSPKQPSPEERLQQAINNAGNDRAALVRNLEAHLKEYPDSRQRPQIYRALVEACLQLRDNARAAGYAERLVALSPDDISMTILTIQLLERNGDEAALRRATNYATRVLEFVERDSFREKSPKISQEDWAIEKKRDRMSVLTLRGRLELKLKDTVAAQKDFEESYAILPSSTSAEQLGEIAEMKKDSKGAIEQYARAFALADATPSTPNPRKTPTLASLRISRSGKLRKARPSLSTARRGKSSLSISGPPGVALAIRSNRCSLASPPISRRIPMCCFWPPIATKMKLWLRAICKIASLAPRSYLPTASTVSSPSTLSQPSW